MRNDTAADVVYNLFVFLVCDVWHHGCRYCLEHLLGGQHSDQLARKHRTFLTGIWPVSASEAGLFEE